MDCAGGERGGVGDVDEAEDGGFGGGIRAACGGGAAASCLPERRKDPGRKKMGQDGKRKSTWNRKEKNGMRMEY